MGNEQSQQIQPYRKVRQLPPPQSQPPPKAPPQLPPPQLPPPQNQPTVVYPPSGYYEEVVGADSGNTTVFMWITSLSTCCASVCTLIVLTVFIIWVFLNSSRQTWF